MNPMKTTDKNISRRDRIRGCLIGGAAGDALGYAIEFCSEDEIFSRFGRPGITEYERDASTGPALISDDTQMTLFTAEGLLAAGVGEKYPEDRTRMRHAVARAYQDWLRTQEMSWEEARKVLAAETGREECDGQSGQPGQDEAGPPLRLALIPDLYSPRAPGNTCLSALRGQRRTQHLPEDFIREPQNHSKGCGGIMRVAPLGLCCPAEAAENVAWEGAQIAAITHGGPLGYMSAAVAAQIIHRLVFGPDGLSLKEIVREARETAAELFRGYQDLEDLLRLIDLAVELSGNTAPDLENIHRLGEGWVAEETLGIALYCALRHTDDFSAALTAAVNHRGDSDSTGAVTGNILGALHGYDALDDKWKTGLELHGVILRLADALAGPAESQR